MLSLACRRFREGFTPGADPLDPHRQSCPACAAFATAMERAAAMPKLPLPDRLRGELRGVLPFIRQDVPRLPVPQAPLPPALRQGLKGIARKVRREPPAWIRSSRYAVAASYFLAIVVTYTLGNPVALSRRAADTLGRTWDQTLGRTWMEVREERLPEVEIALTQRYDTAVGSLESSLSGLRSEVREITDRFSLEWNDKEKP